jgi:hypothetical protein
MDAEQLVAEIARKTGIRLSTADPILAAAVINELLLDKALAKLDRQVQVQADRVTAASTQAVADAKKEAEALLTEPARGLRRGSRRPVRRRPGWCWPNCGARRRRWRNPSAPSFAPHGRWQLSAWWSFAAWAGWLWPRSGRKKIGPPHFHEM